MRCALPLLSLLLLGTSVLAGEWKLVWADEFNKNGLPDIRKWNYESGFVRNKEAQYYTVARKENARVENGFLIIEARKELFPNPKYNSLFPKDWKRNRKYANYTSACLTTFGRASWKYGRIEVRAKLPLGKSGIWPAIWTLGIGRGKVRWPACGEVDIMEYFGKRPDYITCGIHCKKYYWVKKNSKGARLKVEKPWKKFHVFAMEWDQNRIDMFLDGKKYFTYKNEKSGNDAWPYDKPMYLLLNFALGGHAGGKIDDSVLPQKFIIDYVRVYQKK